MTRIAGSRGDLPEWDHHLWLLSSIPPVDVPGKLAGIKKATTLPVKRKIFRTPSSCTKRNLNCVSGSMQRTSEREAGILRHQALRCGCFSLETKQFPMRRLQCFNEAPLGWGQTFATLGQTVKPAKFPTHTLLTLLVATLYASAGSTSWLQVVNSAAVRTGRPVSHNLDISVRKHWAGRVDHALDRRSEAVWIESESLHRQNC